jgi:hexosaminidase
VFHTNFVDAVKTILLALLFTFSLCCMGQQKTLPLIPLPSELKVDTGFFVLNSRTPILEFAGEVRVFNDQLKKLYGFELPVVTKSNLQPCIRLYHGHEGNRNQPTGSYAMRVNRKGVDITAYPEGGFHALESLFQLINGQEPERIHIPALTIQDQPAYPWRGMHLDVCRHFFTKEEVMRYIDYLALYKFNVFHWHLTDDQGWRIEIKKYPLLTKVGSVRLKTVIGKPSDTAKYDAKPYGGFYTQEEVKEVVAYATARHIEVLPEIEMPGHALAALAAYPQYSCTGGPFQPASTWGAFDDVFCPTEETIHFLDDILTEVCSLFPGAYVHIGGDECSKARWKVCPKCQALIAKEGLKDENGLQSYFVRRMEACLNKKGKELIGWDEILEGGLAPGATVMSWRGIQGGVAAAKKQHKVIMSPGKPCYFDHYQSKDRKKEPLAIGGFNPLESVYAFNPLPPDLPMACRQFILGAQGNVWTEYIPDFRQVEYMALPRMCALAEVLWTPALKRNYPSFCKRLKMQTRLLDRMQIHYAHTFLSTPGK